MYCNRNYNSYINILSDSRGGVPENKLSKIFISLFKEMKERIFDTSLIMLSPLFIELMSFFCVVFSD